MRKNTMTWPSTIYEVNIRQYTPEGTFSAFATHLPRLSKMGIKIIWLMPVTPIAELHKKGSLGSPYACASYTKINPQLGTEADFKNLVAEIHACGMRVIIDWVANHTGWDHEWTLSHPEFYKKEASTGAFQIASGMEDIIELDFTCMAMRQKMISALQYWVDAFQIDGFRCDLASWVPADFWEQAQQTLVSQQPLFWLAECDITENPEYAPHFDAAYPWKWMHASKSFTDGHCDFDTVREIIAAYPLHHRCQPLWFTSNHDENSWNGTEYEKYGPWADAWAVFSFTFPGKSLLYTGQEIPLENKRLAFFEKDAVEWPEELKKECFYTTLCNLRNSITAMEEEETYHFCVCPTGGKEEGVLVYMHTTDHEALLTAVNVGKTTANISVNNELLQGHFTGIFSGEQFPLYQVYEKQLEPGAFVVIEKRNI